MSEKRLLMLLSALLLASALALFSSCKSRGKAEAKDDIPTVSVIEVRKGDITLEFKYSGEITADEKSNVNARVPGVLKRIYKDVGARVSKGTVLAALDSAMEEAQLSTALTNVDLAENSLKKAVKGARPEEVEQARAAVSQAETAYEVAQKNYERQESLFKEGVISESALDIARQQRDAAKANLESARERLKIAENTATAEDLKQAQLNLKLAQSRVSEIKTAIEQKRVRSPISGVVADRFVDVGESGVPGIPLFSVVNDRKLKVVVSVPTNEVGHLSVGQRVNIQNDSLNSKDSGGNSMNGSEGEVALEEGLPGSITKIYPASSEETRLVKVEIVPQDSLQLLVGSFCNVTIVRVLATDILIVPRRAILTSRDKSFVFIEDDGTVRRILIKTGPSDNENVAVLDGLKEGQHLILEGQTYVKDGQRVETKKSKKETQEGQDESA